MVSRAITSAILVLLAITQIQAAPRINNLSIRGLQTGATSSLVISGTELDKDTKLILPIEGAKIIARPESKANQLAFDVTLPESTPADIYRLRVVSQTGISNVVRIGVDSFEQQGFQSELTKLPVALTGNLTGAGLIETTFAGKKGKRVVLDIEAQRLGSKLRPVVRLLNSNGTQIAWSGSQSSLQNDARCETLLPEDDLYTVQIHDAMYKGPSPGFFRLKIGDFQYSQPAFPIATQIDTTPKSLAPFTYLPVSKELFSGDRTRVRASNHPEHVEKRGKPNEPQTLNAAPVGVSGKLLSENELDYYLVTVQGEKKYRVEVFAQRLGSSLDSVITVDKAGGGRLGTNDDQANSSDSSVNISVPKGVNQIKIGLKDIQGRYGEEFRYHLVVQPISVPSFKVTTTSLIQNLPAASQQAIKVSVERKGYNGAINLSVPKLPSSFTLAGDVIPAGANSTLLTIASTKTDSSYAISQLIATAKIGDQTITQLVTTNPAPTLFSSEDQFEFGLGTNQSPKLTAQAIWSSNATTASLGGKIQVPVKIVRNGVQGDVRLKLISTQSPIKKQILDPKDKNKKKKITVDDLDRMLRVEKEITIAAKENETSVTILIPKDLANNSWDIALQAELLSKDKKNVLATATTAANRFTLASPLHIELSQPSVIHVSGKLMRSTGFKSPVTITVQGLPKGATAKSVELAADKSDFNLVIQVPAGTDRSQLHKAQVIATAKVDEKEVKSQVLPIKIN